MALSHAILTFLLEGSCSGYDLTKQFDGSVGFFWKASHQQIYRELAKIEASGWASSTLVPQVGKPDKKLYEITESGRQVLIEWMERPSKMAPTRDELLVKLFAGHLVPRAVIFRDLELHRQRHRANLDTYRDIERQHFTHPEALSETVKFQYAALLQGIYVETSWLEWCDRVERLLAEQPHQSQ